MILAMVTLAGGPFHGTVMPQMAGRTEIRMPFRFTDGTVGRAVYEVSPFGPQVFRFDRVLTVDGFEAEQAAVVAALEAQEAAERERREADERERRDREARQAAERARRVAEAQQYAASVEALAPGPLKDVAALHSPEATDSPRYVWIDCGGCDHTGDDDSGAADWPCRTATLLFEHLGMERQAG